MLGDAAVYAIGETRRELLEAVMAHGELTPKQASEVTEVGYELAKKTLKRMADDGQLQASKGRYTLTSSVPGVPMSLDGGQRDSGGTLLDGGEHVNRRERRARGDRGRRPPDVDALLGPRDGGRVPGGCDACDAVQVPRKVAKDVYVIAIEHDDWCPFLAQVQERGSS